MNKFLGNKNLSILITVVLLSLIIWLVTQVSATVFPIIEIFFTGTGPFWIGLVLAFLLNPIVKFLSEKYFKGNKTIGVLVSFTVLTVVLIFVVFPVARDFMNNLQAIMRSITTATGQLLELIGTIDANLKSQILGQITNVGNAIASGIIQGVSNGVSTSMNFFITMIITIFFLLEYDLVKENATTMLGKRRKAIVLEYLEGLEKQMFFYLRSLSFNFVISALVFGVTLHFLGISNAWSFSIIMSLLIGLIPIVGPFIATGILAVITIPVSWMATVVGFFGLFAFMQLFLNVISPKVYANSLDMPNVLIMFSFLLGGTMFGVMGMLLAVPGLVLCIYTYTFLAEKYQWGELE